MSKRSTTSSQICNLKPNPKNPSHLHPPASIPPKRRSPVPRRSCLSALPNPNDQPKPFFPDMEAQSRRVICAHEIQNMYRGRAQRYDAERRDWHATFAQDFVDWVGPIAPNSRILDLACGTGSVTYAAARAAGPRGLVVGVDITHDMLEVAQAKVGAAAVGGGSARIEWARGDVAGDLAREVRAVREVMAGKDGGFDIISCCSAFILLANPDRCLDQWMSLLRPGGRLIIDVPTEARTVQRLWHHEMKKELGMKCLFDLLWVKNQRSLEEKMERAGFEIDKSFRVSSYVPEFWNSKDEVWKVFNKNILLDLSVVSEGKEQAARKIWSRLWESALQDDGRLWNGQALYVVVGRKKI